MNARLEFGSDFLEISDFVHFPEDARGGNPYNSRFDIRVKSGDFSGLAPCEYDIKKLRKFTAELEEMYDLNRECVDMKDFQYESEIFVKMHKTGRITVSGNIYGGIFGEHSLTFEFEADQTALPPFIKGLKEILREYGL